VALSIPIVSVAGGDNGSTRRQEAGSGCDQRGRGGGGAQSANQSHVLFSLAWTLYR